MPRPMRWILLFCLIAGWAPRGHSEGQEQIKQLAHDIFKQLIETNTTDSVGNVTTAAEAMAKRLRDAGFEARDIQVAGPNERKKNLVARFRGTGKRKPILFIGHLDVVEALRADWSTDPFEFIEKDGYFYGRGTEDMKEGDAILITNFIRLKMEGYLPDRDVILALTADEEGGSSNGVDWLLKEHRDWVDAEYCINLDGGEFEKDKDKRLLAGIQASEKVYVDFQFESLNPGGHSSVPSPDNAIYHLAGALVPFRKIFLPRQDQRNHAELFRTQRRADDRTGRRGYESRGPAIPGSWSSGAALGSALFQFSFAHHLCRHDALRRACPQCTPANRARQRQLPDFSGEDPQEVRRTLERVASDPQVKITTVSQLAPDGKVVPVPPSPLLPEVTQAMEKVLSITWPGVPLVATMSTGATDGKYTRIAGIPTFGISCMFFDINDNREHGKDERVGVQDFYDGVDFNYRLIKELSSPSIRNTPKK